MSASRLTIALSLLLLATACSGMDLRRTLGMERKSPDEFKVVSLPPLSLPPEYNLTPPTADSRHVRSDFIDKNNGRQLLTGKATPTELADRTPADRLLLQKAGVERTLPDIRTIIEDDYIVSPVADAEREKSFWDRVKEGSLIIDRNEDAVDADTVDPVSEADRLRRERTVP